METIWLIFVLLFILLLVVGQVFKIYIAYNPYDNNGFLLIKFWFIKLKCFSFEFKPKSIVVHTKKKRNVVEYSFDDPKVKFYENITIGLKEKTKIKCVDIYSKIGTGDSAQTALLSAFLNIIYKIVCAYIKNFKPTCTININPHTDFKNKVFEFSFFGKISLSLFDFLYSIFYACLLKLQNT